MPHAGEKWKHDIHTLCSPPFVWLIYNSTGCSRLLICQHHPQSKCHINFCVDEREKCLQAANKYLWHNRCSRIIGNLLLPALVVRCVSASIASPVFGITAKCGRKMANYGKMIKIHKTTNCIVGFTVSALLHNQPHRAFLRSLAAHTYRLGHLGRHNFCCLYCATIPYIRAVFFLCWWIRFIATITIIVNSNLGYFYYYVFPMPVYVRFFLAHFHSASFGLLIVRFISFEALSLVVPVLVGAGIRLGLVVW